MRKPAAQFETLNENLGNNMFPNLILEHQLKRYGTWSVKFKVRGKSASVNHLKKNNTHVTSKKDIANTLADNFSEKSSSENYSAKFRNKKNKN